jgi:hypothetical protein
LANELESISNVLIKPFDMFFKAEKSGFVLNTRVLHTPVELLKIYSLLKANIGTIEEFSTDFIEKSLNLQYTDDLYFEKLVL